MQHSMEDLVAAAKAAGFGISPRMVQDWVDVGLLDKPERHGRGRRKGVSSTWSDQQRGLLLTELAHRERIGRVAQLCNIPVWTWLYFGDECVPLRQVRRALGTWSGPSLRISATQARQAARQILEDIGHPKTRRQDRKALLDAATEMFFHRSERLDEEALVPLIERVMDPKGRGIVRTLGGMQYTPRDHVHILRVRLKALDGLQEGRIDDSLFHWARFANVIARGGYQRLLTQITTPDGTIAKARVPTIGEIVPRACLDLVTLLGLGIEMPSGVLRDSLENPGAWKANRLVSIVQGTPDPGGVRVTVEVREAEEKESH